MRVILISLAAILCIALISHSSAEERQFLLANDADGYGIDRCLAAGEKCGSAAANAYCRMQAFAAAASYHRIEQDDLGGATAKVAPDSCANNRCNVVAIVCLR
ncbi:MAG TPA: hypothetical protein VFB29_11560 [Pseudolabrys sp.]|nr:hypothetical protein [Pseudolabrys sp.]